MFINLPRSCYTADFTKITKVVHEESVREVNNLLENGWKILTVAEGRDDYGNPEIWYSLGLFESADSPKAD